MNKYSTGIKKDNNSIQIFHQNVQSLNNKKLNIDILLSDKELDSDVLCITEHWLSEKEIGYYNFDNYSLISKFCRENKKNGGSCIYVKSNLEAKPLNSFDKLNQEEHFEASIAELIQYNIIIICVYRTPNSNINIFIETMDTIINNLINKGKQIVIVGDLNIDFLRKRINQKLQTMLNSYGLQAIVEAPTRIGLTSQTAIDQIIINKEIWEYNLKVTDTGFSDHKAQILQIQTQCKNKKGLNRLKEEVRITRSYKEENIQYLNYLLGKENWELVLKQNSVNNAYNEFLGTLRHYYDIAMPKKRVKVMKQENKWVTAGIRISGKKLRFLNSLMKEKNISEGLRKYYRNYKKIYNKVISEAKKLTNNIQIRSSENKSRAMWDIVKAELGNQRKTAKNIEINVNGVHIQDPKTTANLFNEYYTNVAKEMISKNLIVKTNEIDINIVKYNSNSMFLTPTTNEEVIEVIKGMGNKKSVGIDDIPDYVIKKCYPKITPALTYIINLSFSTGQFPEQLKMAKVKPLYKRGPETEVGNYRPVSLLSGFSKIIEKIIKKRLLSFLNKYGIISTKQHGFWKGRSTNTAIADFIEKVYKSLDEREISIGIFLDLSKAFDLVDHDILLRKMSRMGIRGVALKWFQSYLENREQRVEIAYRCIETNDLTSCLSQKRHIKYGVPQGSVLGPVLFLIYINDLETSIKEGRPTLFADDTSIFLAAKNASDAQRKINKTINTLTDWFERNKLIINKEKTVAISFHQPQKIQTEYPLIKLNDTVISYIDYTKFLGVWMDKNLKWRTHTQQLANKLCKICFALRIISRVAGPETVRTLYYAYFQSMLIYGLIFWGNSGEAKVIFKLQKRAIRIMIQIPKTVSCKQYFKLLHILPLPCLYIYEVLVYIKANLSAYSINSEIHSYNTRRKDNLYTVPCNTSLCKNNFSNIGCRMFNQLPQYIKEIPVLHKFKKTLKTFLLDHCFYRVEDFFVVGDKSNHNY
ncbi:hypothetical protein B7P43_G04120 [Cryptotermes secundus]|uniref:Reverse transcriptase domain-containing protein n=1 Tax=Cryptotermes secundus TaxID=105785 RepID=A0A2J7R3N0_9NEOP|nr:hypothetical protein B7P43_G04120 [Cryptotermes secundus]